MKVRVRKVEFRSGVKNNGDAWAGADVLCLFPDGQTACKVYVSDNVCEDLDSIKPGAYFDMWRNPNGYVEIFDAIDN